MIKYLPILSVILILCACNRPAPEPQVPLGPCHYYENFLKGTFTTEVFEGKMVFSGGMQGTFETTGMGFNEMLCRYEVTDCEAHSIMTTCEQAQYPTELIFLSENEFTFDNVKYTRLVE